MFLFQSWTAKIQEKKLAARKIEVSEIGWTIQLPLNFTLSSLVEAQKSYERSVNRMGQPSPNSIYRTGNITILFSAHADKLNQIASSYSSIKGFSPNQIHFTREDCQDRLIRLFSQIPQAQIERSSNICNVGEVSFEQSSFLIVRNGKPVFCMEYIYQVVGEVELSFSMTYNNETHRQSMFKCLAKSTFANMRSASI